MFCVVLGFWECVVLIVLVFGCKKLSGMTAGGIDDTLQDLSLYIKHGILKLQETWNEIGVTDEEQAEKCESVVSSLRSVLDSLVIGERAWQECLEEECTELTERCNESFRALGLPGFDRDAVNLVLFLKRDFLTRKNSELTNEIAAKKEEITTLEERKISCIRKLGLQPDHYPCIQSDNIHRVVSLLQIQIREFEVDMDKRSQCLKMQLRELADLMSSLEIDRCGLIEEGLISDDPDSLLLSDESNERRKTMITKYKAEVRANADASDDLKHQITRLHKLLHKGESIPDEVRKKFKSQRPSALASLKEDLQKLQEQKQEKLEAYVAGLKQEIITFQQLCFQTKCEVSSTEEVTTLTREDPLKTSSSETLELPDIILDNIENRDVSNARYCSSIDDVTLKRDNDPLSALLNGKEGTKEKDSVSELEEELETWESFYRSNRDVFDMVRKWKELNDRFTELESPSLAKYNNRGGSLLQGQKEAAKISKEIPKLEGRVIAEMDKMIGEEIKLNGLSLEDYFQDNRATTALTRVSSLRRSRKKSDKSPGKTTTEDASKSSHHERSKSMRDKKGSRDTKSRESIFSRSTSDTKSRESIASRTSVGSRKSMRKRMSRDTLDRVGLP